ETVRHDGGQRDQHDQADPQGDESQRQRGPPPQSGARAERQGHFDPSMAVQSPLSPNNSSLTVVQPPSFLIVSSLATVGYASAGFSAPATVAAFTLSSTGRKPCSAKIV